MWFSADQRSNDHSYRLQPELSNELAVQALAIAKIQLQAAGGALSHF